MTILAAEFRIKNKGTFDLKGLYEYLHLWVVEEGYASSSDPQFPEVFHSQHEFGNQGLKEHVIWWRLEKVPDQNNYYKYELDLDWRSVAIKDVELVLKHFNEFYWKVIMKSTFEKRKLELYREAYRLQETIKDYWKLMPGTEEPEHDVGFWPQEGVGE